MRKLFIILAFIFAVIGIAFVILPMGTFGLLPIGLSLVFGVLALVKSTPEQKNIPKWLLIFSALLLLIVIVRSFIPDEVEKDRHFEQKKIESKKEDLQDLENL